VAVSDRWSYELFFCVAIKRGRGVICPWPLASRGDDHSMFPYESKFFDF
jgi:hypothetical protein